MPIGCTVWDMTNDKCFDFDEAKTTKKIVLKLQCQSCNHYSQHPIKRCKHSEIIGDKKGKRTSVPSKINDIEGQNLVLSTKHSLINCANDIPSEISQMHPGVVVHGYICNIIEAGCFVRFLGHLTGFSAKDKAVDRRIERLSDAFYVGQSVRSHILSVNAETARVKLALQQSMCSSTDSSFIQGYFLLDQKDYYFYNDDSGVQQLFGNPQL
ncbi:rRNA biogenesis protein RRP5-like isoform X1 [Miscanthus floridulus]|uniref:rRNA biogenesis protein RRP5-like isoform X1 n=2 Tax=Miscanthus floridulus TaxID=154761 RepID=UPI00345ACEAA